MNIILCGLPASGKSSAGRSLAKRLSWAFCDTDQLIEEEGLSCRALYLEKGQAHFRFVEKKAIMRLEPLQNTVIATGGGALCDHENSLMLRKLGCVVYLQIDLKTVWQRLSQRGMPVYLPVGTQEQAFYLMAQERIPWYIQAAHAVINTDGMDPETIATEVLNRYGK